MTSRCFSAIRANVVVGRRWLQDYIHPLQFLRTVQMADGKSSMLITTCIPPTTAINSAKLDNPGANGGFLLHGTPLKLNADSTNHISWIAALDRSQREKQLKKRATREAQAKAQARADSAKTLLHHQEQHPGIMVDRSEVVKRMYGDVLDEALADIYSAAVPTSTPSAGGKAKKKNTG